MQQGDVVARLVLEDETVRVFRTTVVEVGDGYVIDAEGNRHELDRARESPDLVEIDAEIEHELRVKGDGYAVVEEGRLRDPWKQDRQEPEIDGPAR